MFSEPEKNIAQFHVEPGMTVVDIGAGIGHYSTLLSKAVGDAGHVYAIEIQQDLLKKLKTEADKNHLRNIDIIWSDVEEENGSTLVDHIADRIIISNVLFQVRDREAVIRESARILKPKGKLLIIDWSESHGGLGPKPADVISEEEVVDSAKRYGFELERKINTGQYHYGLIFKTNG